MHTPVLLQEAIEGLNIKRDGLYIDATAGEGGHLVEIVKRGGRVLGIDLDKQQIISLTKRHPEHVSGSQNEMLKRVQHDNRVIQGNFADIENIARKNNFVPADGVLFDLGLSMRQIENSGRGFSFKKLDEPLDMRIDTNLITTVTELVNGWDENELYELLARYSEDINSRSIAQEIVRYRQKIMIKKVKELNEIIDAALGKKDVKTYARIFQALRIAVNHELDNLKLGLAGALHILKTGGRIVVISFHSLEDRITKQFILKNNLRQLNKKVITVKQGVRYERSAKLRIIEK